MPPTRPTPARDSRTHTTPAGFENILVRGCFDHLRVLFAAGIVLFMAGCIDYHALYRRVEDSGCHRISLFTAGCGEPAPLDFGRLSSLSAFGWVCITAFALGLLGSAAVFGARLRKLWRMRRFYKEVLRVDTVALRTVPWGVVVRRLVRAQAELQMVAGVQGFDELSVHILIGRRSNYKLGLYNHSDTLRQALTVRLPLMGEWTFLPESLQWSIERVLLSAVYDHGSTASVSAVDPAKRRVVVAQLRRWFRVFGVLSFVLSPVLLLWRVAFFLFRNADSIRNSGGPFGTRVWSPLARWQLRLYSELEHDFRARLAKAYTPSLSYVAQFGHPLVASLAQFLSFVFGGLLVVLLAMSFIFDEEFLVSDLTPDRSVTWWLGVLGVATAVARAMVPPENALFEPEPAMAKIVECIKYAPQSWMGREGTLRVAAEFGALFQYKGLLLLEELLSLFIVSPFLLIFRLPRCAEEIADFYQRSTVTVPGIGHVCRYACFESPRTNLSASAISTNESVYHADAKSEHSRGAFMRAYPQWQIRASPAVLAAYDDDGAGR